MRPSGGSTISAVRRSGIRRVPGIEPDLVVGARIALARHTFDEAVAVGALLQRRGLLLGQELLAGQIRRPRKRR